MRRDGLRRGFREAGAPGRRGRRRTGEPVVRRDEGVPHELDPQARVRVAARLEGEDDCERVEVAGHVEAAAGPRGPDLRADVVEGPHPPPSLRADAAQAQRLGDPQVDPRVVDKADGRGAVRCRSSATVSSMSALKKREVPAGPPRSRPRRRPFGRAEAGPRPRRGAGPRAPRPAGRAAPRGARDHPGRVLVARVLPGDDQEVGRAALRRRAGGRRVRPSFPADLVGDRDRDLERALAERGARPSAALERATLSTKCASSSASGSPFSIGIWWTGTELVSPAFTRPTFILSPKAMMSLFRTRCPDWFMKSSDR